MSSAHFIQPTLDVPFTSLPHLLEHQAKRIPERPAILAPGRAPLSYSRLYQHIEQTGHALRAIGIGRHDRVGVLLPNGPEMAVAALAVETWAVCAPLNPSYGAEELDRYFADLRPRALIMEAGTDSMARRMALSCGIPIVELSAGLDAEAGVFTIMGGKEGKLYDESVSLGDVALLLLTSGTTSRPKIVPLTHAKICAAAYTWGTALALREADRCLNVMPLFHAHGLIATVLASLSAGASVVCTPGCDVNSFFGWLTEFRPTWYSAVPTMHQAILAEARRLPARVPRYRLRFVRSGAAPLPRRVFAELEKTFATCVIEFCGMTETASAPIACNPLPPRQRKPGSIGIRVSLDVKILDEGGAFLPSGRTGEIVVRGASVMSGYGGDPMATRTAFAGDWFKTGDQGFFDDEGYLFLVGRSREIINRGGEKIAPREIDDVLLEHPAVAEAVTFAVPHPTLGEDVAAAIVLQSDAAATPDEIRQSIIGRIAHFKVPRHVLIVGEIPRAPMGKVQRVDLAAKLGFASGIDLRRTFVAPRTALEKMLARCWGEVLRVERLGIHDDFFAMGGDSLLVLHVLARVHEIMNLDIEASRFFESPTIEALADHLETLIAAKQATRASSVIVLAPREDGVLPTSIPQERLWKLQQALPGVPLFNILYALRVTSVVDTVILERSVNEVVRRHEILRTTFSMVDGQCVQIIAPQLSVQLRFDDLQTLSETKKETAGRQIIQEELIYSFDLAQGTLFRARLMRLAEREHLLLITMHQIIADGLSLGVLVDELFTLYDAFLAEGPSPLAPLPFHYADFAYWQRRWKSHPDMVAQLQYWRKQLSGPLPAIEFANARPQLTIDAWRTAQRGWVLPASLLEAAKRLSQRESSTLFMALVSAFKTLLHRYLGVDDLRVATLVANRNRLGTAAVIGPLVNTIILRTNLGGDPSLREVMRRVRATTLGAFANQELPFEVLAETLERERDLKPASLAQVMVTLQNATLPPMASSRHALTFEEASPNMLMPLATITSFNVILTLHEAEHGLAGSCIYKPYLFDSTTIDRMLQNLQSVLEEMVTQPERPISSIQVSLDERP